MTILLFPAILLILIKKHYEVTVTKKLFEKLKNKFINFCKWVWSECKDWHTLVLFAIVVVLMYAPVWLGYILYFVFKSKWAMGVASAYLVFWAGPLPGGVGPMTISMLMQNTLTAAKIQNGLEK